MNKVSQADLELLAEMIIQNIRADFAVKHLSGNLVNTIQVENTKDGIKIIIPAEIYDIYQYLDKGVIIKTGQGSYASELDINGSSFGRNKTHNHKGYVDRAIDNAVNMWVSSIQDKMQIEGIERL